MILVRAITDRYSGSIIARLRWRKQYDASNEDVACSHVGDVYILELDPDATLRQIRRWLTESYVLDLQVTRPYKDAACIVEKAMGSCDYRVSESVEVGHVPTWFSFLEKN